jgi:RNA polymerase sigma-70 factor (ECF subfamily)
MVEQHFGFIWRYLRGLGISEAEADDVAQQVFITASSKIDVIDVGAERSFLVSTAHGVAANARRAVGRRREIAGGDGLDVAADPSVGAEQELETKEALALLDRFLASLSDDVREVFVLFELEGLTMAAIAADLRLAPGTVASRLRRAREQFQEMTRRFQAARERERR